MIVLRAQRGEVDAVLVRNRTGPIQSSRLPFPRPPQALQHGDRGFRIGADDKRRGIPGRPTPLALMRQVSDRHTNRAGHFPPSKETVP